MEENDSKNVANKILISLLESVMPVAGDKNCFWTRDYPFST